MHKTVGSRLNLPTKIFNFCGGRGGYDGVFMFYSLGTVILKTTPPCGHPSTGGERTDVLKIQVQGVSGTQWIPA